MNKTPEVKIGTYYWVNRHKEEKHGYGTMYKTRCIAVQPNGRPVLRSASAGTSWRHWAPDHDEWFIAEIPATAWQRFWRWVGAGIRVVLFGGLSA